LRDALQNYGRRGAVHVTVSFALLSFIVLLSLVNLEASSCIKSGATAPWPL